MDDSNAGARQSVRKLQRPHFGDVMHAAAARSGEELLTGRNEAKFEQETEFLENEDE